MFIPPESWGFGFTLLFCAVPKTGRVVGAPSGGHSLLSGHPASRWTGRLPFLAAFHAAGPPGCLRHRRRPLSPTSSLNQVPAGAPSVPMDAHAWVSVPCGLSGGCRETVNPRPVGCYLDFSSSPPSDLCSAFLSPRRAAARTCPGERAAVAGRNSWEHPAGPGTRSRPLLACASNTPPG